MSAAVASTQEPVFVEMDGSQAGGVVDPPPLQLTRLGKAMPSLYLICTAGATFGLAYLLFGASFLPGGAGWALVLLYSCATVAGKLVPLVYKRLPPLLGMLASGLLLRNVPGGALNAPTDLLGNTFEWWSRTLRAAALAVIMLRAGLGLDLDKLRKHGVATARLATLPCLFEALTVLGLSYPLLDFPPVWGGTLGFVLAAVSPAVVVPGMLDLKERGYGVAKGVPTMVVAAASFDDVLAIAGFSVCLALAANSEAGSDAVGVIVGSNTTVSSPPIAWLVLKAPTELLGGIGYGLLCGLLAAAPASELAAVASLTKHFGKTLDFGAGAHARAVVVAALVAVIGGKAANASGGGALGAIVLGATAGRVWPDKVRKPVQASVNHAWALLQPALFGLLGAAVDVTAIQTDILGRGVGLIAAALFVRICVTRIALLRSGLEPREAALACVAWLPKATVQAAVGGTALDLVQERGFGPQAEARGSLVLMLSVLVILLTAPIGAVGIAILGPKWLTKDGGADEPQTPTTNVA